jgi:hypothetical protein
MGMELMARSLVCAGLFFALAACGGRPQFVSPNAAMERNHALGLLLEYDFNQDQLLSGAEFENALQANFSSLDRNNDGSLDSLEVSAENDRRWQISGSSSTPLIDCNTDGFVDFVEFTSTLNSTFIQMDEDDDGNLSAEELAIIENNPPSLGGAPQPPGTQPDRASDGFPLGG